MTLAAIPERLAALVRPLAWASLVANIGIVVTGGVVRLTSSGLGCPTWPRCTAQSLVPHRELGINGVIEFSNRLLTYVLAAIAIAVVIAVWKRPGILRKLAIAIALGIPAQGVIGGITVLTGLNPWIVAFHLICSMAMIGLCVLFLWKLYVPDAVTATGPSVWLAWATFAAGWLVLYAGTIVTGAGPHAGDLDAKRNGLNIVQVAQLHVDLVFLFIGLSVGLLLCALAVKAPRGAVVAVGWLIVVELLQGTIGFVQYFTDLPIVLVAFHMLGAAVLSAAMTWALLRVRQPVSVTPVTRS